MKKSKNIRTLTFIKAYVLNFMQSLTHFRFFYNLLKNFEKFNFMIQASKRLFAAGHWTQHRQETIVQEWLMYTLQTMISQDVREKEREMDRRRESSTGYKQFIHQWFIPKGMFARSIQRASRKQEDTSARCLLSAELFWVKCFCSAREYAFSIVPWKSQFLALIFMREFLWINRQMILKAERKLYNK